MAKCVTWLRRFFLLGVGVLRIWARRSLFETILERLLIILERVGSGLRCFSRILLIWGKKDVFALFWNIAKDISLVNFYLVFSFTIFYCLFILMSKYFTALWNIYKLVVHNLFLFISFSF